MTFTGLPMKNLRPGELITSTEPIIISTILGSCVAVTMFAPHKEIGAACHALLPSIEESRDKQIIEKFKYVDSSIEEMISYFSRKGISVKNIEVKVFGGSDMFDQENRNRDQFSVGRKNIITAFNIIKERKMDLVNYDVGGPRGRKILFNTQTGQVLVKKLKKRPVIDFTGI